MESRDDDVLICPRSFSAAAPAADPARKTLRPLTHGTTRHPSRFLEAESALGWWGDRGTFYSAYGDPVTMCGHHAGSLGVSGGAGWLSQDLGDSPGVGARWRGLSGGTGTSQLR